MSQYADAEYKFVAVLNTKVDTPKLFNALGHVSAGLTAEHADAAGMRFLRYEDGDGGVHPGISHYPFIVLAARNGNQIRTLRQGAIEKGITYCDFVDTMLGESADAQLRQTKAASEIELDYFAIVLFGSAKELGPLTRKFSVFH
jgi:hypothetical protein